VKQELINEHDKRDNAGDAGARGGYGRALTGILISMESKY